MEQTLGGNCLLASCAHEILLKLLNTGFTIDEALLAFIFQLEWAQTIILKFLKYVALKSFGAE